VKDRTKEAEIEGPSSTIADEHEPSKRSSSAESHSGREMDPGDRAGEPAELPKQPMQASGEGRHIPAQARDVSGRGAGNAGESGGGPYPNPWSESEIEPQQGTFEGHGGQSVMAYFGEGQAGPDKTGETHNSVYGGRPERFERLRPIDDTD